MASSFFLLLRVSDVASFFLCFLPRPWLSRSSSPIDDIALTEPPCSISRLRSSPPLRCFSHFPESQEVLCATAAPDPTKSAALAKRIERLNLRIRIGFLRVLAGSG